MKKRVVLALAILLTVGSFAGCGLDKEEVQAHYGIMIAAKAEPAHLDEIVDFLDEYVSQMGEENASHMVAAYEEYLYQYVTNGADKVFLSSLLTYYDKDKKKVDEDKLKGSEVEETYYQLLDACAKPVFYEEALSLRVDYEALLERYGEYLEEGLKALYTLSAEAVAEPMLENATLMIGWDEVLSRALEAETLLKEYGGDHLVQSDALRLFKLYLSTLMMGTANTPVFDYTTKAFREDVKQAEQDFMKQHPDTVLTEMLKEYDAYLESIGYQLDYNDSTMGKAFFDTCDYILSQAEKKVME